MTADDLLIGLLVVYTLIGWAFALNLGRIGHRIAASYARLPWALRIYGADNPNAHRAGGLIMVSFGMITLAWLAVQRVWVLPPLSRFIAVAALVVTGLAGLAGGLVVIRRRPRSG